MISLCSNCRYTDIVCNDCYIGSYELLRSEDLEHQNRILLSEDSRSRVLAPPPGSGQKVFSGISGKEENTGI